MTAISVVIPVYNGERTIREAISSVLRQTFQDFELIVIDDGSQDSTVDILASIHDSRLRYFSYPNAGPSASRNRGFVQACGEYISFLDADDLWTPDKLEAQLIALREKPEAAVSYSWTDFIDEAGKPLGYGIHHTANGYIFPDLLERFFIGSGSNALIRSAVFDQVGGFDESVVPAEDWDIFLRLAARYLFIAVPKAQILYRVVEDSLSGNVLRQERAMVKMIERAYSHEPGKSFQHLRKYTYANMYRFLSDRALKSERSRQNWFHSARFLWRSFTYDPRILKQGSYVLTLILKLASSIVLTKQQVKALRAMVKSLAQRFTKTAVDNRGQ